MKKVFISLPMNGLTKEKVLVRMELLKKKAEERYGEPLEMIDTYTKDFEATGNHPRLMYLGDSIMQMASADYIYFANDWHAAKGCLIEMEIAREYNIPFDVEPFSNYCVDGYTRPFFVKEEYRDKSFGKSYFPVRIINTILFQRIKDGESTPFMAHELKLEYIHGKTINYFMNIRKFGDKSWNELIDGLEKINREYGERIIQ